jgi:hypothetical protein
VGESASGQGPREVADARHGSAYSDSFGLDDLRQGQSMTAAVTGRELGMTPKSTALEISAICGLFILLALWGIVWDFTSGLLTSGIDGIMLLFVCAMMAGIFFLIMLMQLNHSGILPTPAFLRPAPKPAAAAKAPAAAASATPAAKAPGATAAAPAAKAPAPSAPAAVSKPSTPPAAPKPPSPTAAATPATPPTAQRPAAPPAPAVAPEPAKPAATAPAEPSAVPPAATEK